MKAIKDMNLSEIAQYLTSLVWVRADVIDRLCELHEEHEAYTSMLMSQVEDAQMEYRTLCLEHEALKEQTRWIPVSERMPTEADGKWVRWFIPDDRFGGYDDVERPIYPPRNATHWQRITPPEDL